MVSCSRPAGSIDRSESGHDIGIILWDDIPYRNRYNSAGFKPIWRVIGLEAGADEYSHYFLDAQGPCMRLRGGWCMLHMQDAWLAEREILRRRPCEDPGC
jgi:hypothetical protein